MSKKTVVIITVSLIIFLLALLAYLFLINSNGEDGGTDTGFRSFLPFGGGSGSSGEDENTSSNNTNNDGTDNSRGNNTNDQTNNLTGNKAFTSRLRKLSDEPVSGAGTFDVKAGSIVRYMEKATGHVYEVEMFSPKKGRISNTTVPLAYEATWLNKGNSLVARYLKNNNQDISTFIINLKSTSTSTETTASAVELPESISSVSAYGNSIFYLVSDANGSVGYITNNVGDKSKQIWSSPLRDITSQYINEKSVVLASKPNENTDGFIYKIDTSTGTITRLLNKIPGLVGNVSSNESWIVYLKQFNGFDLYLYDLKKHESKNLTFETFPEKCVWSKKNTSLLYCAIPLTKPSANSLTAWYKGTLETNDSIWLYDTNKGYLVLVSDLTKDSNGENIDVVDPILSEKDDYLIFKNKIDDSLWSYDLKTVSTSTPIGD